MNLFSAPGSFTMNAVRSTVGGFLPNGGGVIEAYAPAADGYGGFTETWQVVPNGTVNYRINPLTFGQIETLALQEGVKVEYSIDLPYNAPIAVGNRFNASGTPYNVRWMQKDVSNSAFVKIAVSRDQ